MKKKTFLKFTTSNKAYKIAKQKSVLTHETHGWCSGCKGPCDWKYFQSSKKRNLGKKPKNLNKPWSKTLI